MFKKRLTEFVVKVMLLFFSFLPISYAEQLHMTDMTYEGAFRLPDESSNGSHWDYGGRGLGFYPNGDPSGSNDGYPGSLFSAGSVATQGEKRRDVSEFSIPVPIISSSVGSLNTATTLQGFQDITGGYFESVLGAIRAQRPHFRGLQYLEAQPGQKTGKMYWSFWDAYNVSDNNHTSHGYSEINLSNVDAQGCWRVGNYHAKSVAGYMFDIPRQWADTHIDGHYIASAVCRKGGDTRTNTLGPGLFATAPYKYSNSSPPPGGELPATALIYYNQPDQFPGYTDCDEWGGGAWITAGTKEAVIYVGFNCTSCTYDHSWVGGGRQLQMIFYDINELEEVAAGAKNPWEPIPYETVYLTPYSDLFSDSLTNAVWGLSYDRGNGLLYMIQERRDGTKPLIHVFRIKGGGDDGNGTTPAALSISTNSLADGIIDENYQTSLTANGGVPPYTWTIESGSLPVDLSLSSSGGISGVPLFDGTNSFTVKVTDSDSPNSTAIKNFNITVNIFSTLSILTTTLSSAFIDDAYNESIVAEGGVSPYTWRLAGGALPQGLSLSSAGILSGIPIMETSSSFTVEVVDNSGSVKTKQFTLSVSGSSSDTDMIGYWALDEGSGVDALDTAGRTNTLKINGSSWTIGRLGAALNFNGASNYAYRSDSSLSGAFPAKSVGAAKDFTLAAWIFLDKINSRQPIVSKQGNGNRGFLFLVEDSNKLSLQLFNNSDIRTEIFSSSTFDAGQWYHVAATYDYVGDGNSSLILYINGVKDASTDSAVGPVRGNNEAFELGRYYWGGGYSRYMDGSIDDVQLYQRALSAEEIAAIVFGNEDSAPAEVPEAPTNLEVIMD